MLTSMLKTLASKHRSTVTKIAAKHKAKIQTPHGLRRCFEVVLDRGGASKPLVARFGGIPLRRQKTAVILDRRPDGITYPRKELVTRLHRGRCELCQQPGTMEVHHVRNLAELAELQPAAGATAMTRRRRKTLVVCASCHGHIHGGKPVAALTA
jgi:cytochrome c553